jgi:hypothetical protein
MQTKEHLLYFFLSKSIRLHYSDRKFFNKLTIIIKDTNTITTGQDKLFSRLIDKYESQLSKTNLTKDQLLALPWKASVVETSNEYTSARVTLINNDIVIRVPMNNKFITKFDDLKDNTFQWDKNKKAYISLMSTYALKIAYTILPKYFPEVRYCKQLTNLINKTVQYSELIWEPTLVLINNNYYVVAINEALGTYINNIELNNDPKTLFALSKLGIKISKDIISSDLQKFASEFVTEIDVSQTTELVDWLKELEVVQVLLGKGVHNAFSKIKQLFLPMLTTLDNNGITCIPVDSNFEITKDIRTPVLLQYHGNENMKFCGNGSLAKCVFIKNSNPIEVQ